MDGGGVRRVMWMGEGRVWMSEGCVWMSEGCVYGWVRGVCMDG